MARDWNIYVFFAFVGTILLKTISLEGSNTPVILSPEDPRVLLYFGDKWGYICAAGWDAKAAQVVCRMKGHWHGEGKASFQTYQPGNNVVLSSVTCRGDESDISQCVNMGNGDVASCPGGSVAAIDCSVTDHSTLRLVGGYGQWEGRVEIRVKDGDWRPVCSESWTDEDARVVCRQLGIRDNGGKAHIDGKYVQSSAPTLITNTECVGSEPNLASCPAVLVTNESCTIQAGVECYDCGAEYTSETGIVQSKNFPNEYPSNENCLYVINPPSDGRLYKLTFTDFVTEECCDKLTLKVFEGNKTTASSQVFSGETLPPSTIGTSFHLQFSSDGTRGERGFQANWAVTNIADTVTASCDNGQFNISAYIPLLKRIYPYTNLSAISLADASCVATVQGKQFVMNQNISECGSKVMNHDGIDVYSNYIVERIYDTHSDLIVRGHSWRLPISCSVDTSGNFSFHYTPFSETRKRREIDSTIHHNKSFDVTMDIYKDKLMQLREDNPVHNLGDELYIRVGLKQTMDDIKMVVNECFANPTRDVNFMRYSLINNSCEVDTQTHFIQRQQKYTDFRMNFFEFAGDYPYVYIACDVSVCLSHETTGQCSGCSRSSSKRDIEYYDDSKQMTVRIGPLQTTTV